jgi:hypothetical protein
MSIDKLEKEVRELRKENKELITHNKFLVQRLDKWAERNFELRTEFTNMPLTEKIKKLQEMFDKKKEQVNNNENRP